MSKPKTLNIILKNIIPPNKTDITFKGSMLYKPPTKEKDGSETTSTKVGENVYYSDEKYYPKLSQSEMMKFLFDKKRFDEVMSEQPAVDASKKEAVQKYNITATLQCLFSVGYPAINDINDSHSLLNGKAEANTLFFNPFKSHLSYLKIGGDEYTVQRVIWLNDGYNVGLCKVPNATGSEKDFVSPLPSNNTIYVMIDLIRGVLTSENRNSIYCPFTSEILVKRIDDLIKGNDRRDLINNGRILFDIKQMKGIQGADSIVTTAKTPEEEALSKEMDEWEKKSETNKIIRKKYNGLVDNVKTTVEFKILLKTISQNKLLKIITEKESDFPKLFQYLKNNFEKDQDKSIEDALKKNAKSEIILKIKEQKRKFKEDDTLNMIALLLEITESELKGGGSRIMKSYRYNRKRVSSKHKKTRRYRK
uniref:Uncharacterized protein n=1 Tax=viral metagenome TaxID=1070528 RepID=A0A6C0ASQ8_9ZZZZ